MITSRNNNKNNNNNNDNNNENTNNTSNNKTTTYNTNTNNLKGKTLECLKKDLKTMPIRVTMESTEIIKFLKREINDIFLIGTQINVQILQSSIGPHSTKLSFFILQ